MAERKLAHIELVHDIRPIEGADFIEACSVLGWNLVCGKGEFKEGDKCVYIEIDSRVDVTKPVFEFMAKNDGKVKTRKFRGIISQGIALSLDKFDVDLSKYDVGDDVTKVLGITKIQTDEEKRLARESVDPRINRVNSRYKKFMKSRLGKWIMKHKFTRNLFLRFFGGKKCKPKAWPDFISKTDETRIENMPWQLEDKRTLEVTEKLDGTSTTFFIKKKHGTKYEFGVCSRNVRQLDREQACFHEYNIYWAMADKYKVQDVLERIAVKWNYPEYIVLQGESIGKVQGNPYKLEEDDFYGFNFIIDGKKMDSVDAAQLMKHYGIKWVPILQTDFVCPDTMEEMKKLSHGNSIINPSVLREGCVYRDADNTVSFKNVDNEYLLKRKE